MPIDVHCDCGNVFSVGLELAGKKLRCKGCKVVLKVPLVPVGDSQESGPPSMEYEVLKEDAGVTCSTCGAAGKTGDSVCLACGAELGSGSPGLVERIPKPVLLGGLGLLVAVVLGVVGAKIYSSARLSNLIAQGQDRLSKGDLKGARSTFDEVLKLQKDHPAAVEGLVQCAFNEGKWTTVKQYAPGLIGKLPKGEKRARIRLDLARAQLETGDWANAQRTARDAESDDASIRGVDEVVGLALMGANEKIEAATVLKKADQDGSRDPRVGLALAKLAEEKGDVKGARTWADKASAFAGSDATVWLECARLRERDGDHSAALGALRKACEADPKSAKARIELAFALVQAGSAPEAVKVAQEAKELASDDARGALALGQALLETGDLPAAKAELERSEKGSGDDPTASLLLGRVMIKLNDPDGGTDKLEKALKKVEKDPVPYVEAGRVVLNETPHVDRAIAFLDKAVGLEPRAPTADEKKLFAEARLLLARALAKVESGRTKNDKRIETLLKDAIEDDPKRRDAYLDLGTHLQAVERADRSVEVLEKGLEHFPDDQDLLYKGGVGALKARQFDKSVKLLEKLVSISPEYPDAKNKLDAAKYGLQMEQ